MSAHWEGLSIANTLGVCLFMSYIFLAALAATLGYRLANSLANLLGEIL